MQRVRSKTHSDQTSDSSHAELEWAGLDLFPLLLSSSTHSFLAVCFLQKLSFSFSGFELNELNSNKTIIQLDILKKITRIAIQRAAYILRRFYCRWQRSFSCCQGKLNLHKFPCRKKSARKFGVCQFYTGAPKLMQLKRKKGLSKVHGKLREVISNGLSTLYGHFPCIKMDKSMNQKQPGAHSLL